MKLEGKKILVVGTGISGIAATELLLKKNIKVVLFDGNKDLDTAKLYEKSPLLRDVPLILGELSEEQMKEFEVVVLSPGVPTDLPMVNAMRDLGIAIWGEIELAFYFAKGRVVAITGTNGKTTTTALTGEILSSYFDDVKVVGNIGIPYTSVALDTTDETITVAEISSFQLETIKEFRPVVSAILNITPDHLDRHHTMEAYIKAKEDVTKNQTTGDICVLNYEDEVLREFSVTCPATVKFFSGKQYLRDGYYYTDGLLVHSKDGAKEVIVNVDDMNILGAHNYENAMCACAIAESLGVPMEKIHDTLCTFQAVEHRIEYVTEKRGVRFYNDSKGTNPDAAIKGIGAMNRPTFLIGGGYDKNSEYDEWIESFDGKVKELVLIGQTAEKIERCAHAHGFKNTIIFEDFEEAILHCYNNAISGDAVLLSPACASWGMFPNYEVRGKMFKEIVNNLKE